jgi:hypothetical protein
LEWKLDFFGGIVRCEEKRKTHPPKPRVGHPEETKRKREEKESTLKKEMKAKGKRKTHLQRAKVGCPEERRRKHPHPRENFLQGLKPTFFAFLRGG